MTDDNTRQEAVERATQALFDQEPTRGWWDEAAWAIDASGLLDANNQLRQRVAEAEGLLARLYSVALGDLSTAETNVVFADYDAYRTKYTPEPPE